MVLNGENPITLFY